MADDRTPAPQPQIEAATAAPFGRGRAARHTARSPAGSRFRPVRSLPVFLTLRRYARAGRADALLYLLIVFHRQAVIT